MKLNVFSLKRLSLMRWQVNTYNESLNFNNIDDACNWLATYSVSHDTIDSAVIEMFALGHNVAYFSQDGSLQLTEFKDG